MRKFVLLASYILLLPCVIILFSAYYLVLLKTASAKQDLVMKDTSQYQAVTQGLREVDYTAHENEARVEVLQAFFKRYNSPLLSYAQKIVSTADKYSLDWRLLPAIAMQESNLCKKIPKNSYNCWGFGIYSGKVTRFSNFDQAIETVTKTLARDYKEKQGLEEPTEIVTRYTPGNNGSWANGVNYFMSKIQLSL